MWIGHWHLPKLSSGMPDASGKRACIDIGDVDVKANISVRGSVIEFKAPSDGITGDRPLIGELFEGNR